jgi:hypothetical protein
LCGQTPRHLDIAGVLRQQKLTGKMNREMIGEAAVEIEIGRQRGIDENAISRRDDALSPLLLDAARAFQLQQQKEMLAEITANVVLVAAHEFDIRGDLNDFQPCRIGQRYAAGDGNPIFAANWIEAATDRLQLQAPLLQRRLPPDFGHPALKFLELHGAPSSAREFAPRWITC